MDKLTSHNRDCWICCNNENNMTLTTVSWEKVLKYCETYLDNSIIIKSFENETAISCCSCCYDSAHELTVLEKQLERLQKEISDLSSLFSRNVLERQSLFKNDKNESDNKSSSPANKCLTTENNSDGQPKVMIENFSLRKEVIESELNESTSHYQRGDLFNGLWFDADEHENKDDCEIAVNSEEEIDVKYSFDEDDNSQTNADSNNKTIRTSAMADPLKCLKKPIIQLTRIQPSRKTSQKIFATIAEEMIKCKKDEQENELYKCSICGQEFNKKCDLQNHVISHNQERHYACSFCDKSFLKASGLKLHEKLHTQKGIFTCRHCSKLFKTLQHLNAHAAIHSGQKRFKCTYCEKSFLSAALAKIHERVHTGERPFDCSFCTKSFIKSYSLKIHERIHTGERPYKCSICDKTFKQQHHVKSHRESNHKEHIQ